LKSFGIPVANSLFLRSEFEVSPGQIVDELGLPVFVKPSDSGSSYGISKVKTKVEIQPALQKSFAEGGTTVVESFLDGVEVTCGVYRNMDGIQALPLTEIASENEFFDYDAKYNGKSQEITPARVSVDVKLKVQERAKYIYSLLQLRSIARIDFMIVNDEPFVIEVNTTPGFSSASIVPQMLACLGLSITDFWKEIIKAEETAPASGRKKDIARSVAPPDNLFRDIGEIDKIAASLPQVKGLGDISDAEFDALAQRATDAYDDLMDLGMNVEARYSSRVFEVAGTMLKNAIDAKSAKIDKKLKMIELQLKKAKLDQDATKGDDPDNPITGEGVLITDRNSLLAKLKNMDK
jgi:hypothetical protein